MSVSKFPSSTSTLLATLTLLLSTSFPAYAVDATGYTATAFIILLLGSVSVMNLILNGLFFFAGKYQSKRFSRGHTFVSLILPTTALIWTLIDHVGIANLALNCGLIMISVGLSLLPLLLTTHSKAQHQYSSLILTMGAIGILALAYFLPPLALFSIVVCHLSFNDSSHRFRPLSLLTLAISYSMLIYWIYQTVESVVAK